MEIEFDSYVIKDFPKWVISMVTTSSTATESQYLNLNLNLSQFLHQSLLKLFLNLL